MNTVMKHMVLPSGLLRIYRRLNTTNYFQRLFTAQRQDSIKNLCTTTNMSSEKKENGICSGQFKDLIRSDLHDYCPASNLAFNETVKNMIAKGEKVYHFGFGQSPFPIEEGMVKGLQEHAGEHAYLPVAGIPELREAICGLHARHDNLTSLKADQVVVGPGTKQLMYLTQTVFNGDILLLSPSWTTYKPQIQLSGHKVFIIDTKFGDEWRVQPDQIGKCVLDNGLKGNKILVLCNPDNPTGTGYSASQLKDISDVCRRLGIIVLSDEIYSRLHYDGTHQTIAQFYPEGTIISSGFSKWASAGGWRLGYHIFPDELSALKEAVLSAGSHTHSCAPAPMQRAVAQALKDTQAVDAYMKHCARIMSAVGLYCHAELTSVGVKVVKPRSGYYIFPDFEVVRAAMKKRGVLTGEKFCETVFKEAKVAFMSGGPGFLRPLEEFTVRLCYVNFNGEKSLQESRRIGLDSPLPADFVEKFCRPVHEGIQALKVWVEKQKMQ